MDVLIVHYHLNPGGVTKIIEAQIKALETTGSTNEILVVCGNSNEKKTISGIPVKVIPLFDYYSEADSQADQENALEAIISGITGLISKSFVVHFHNANLGKNPFVTAAAYRLAAEGYAVVNHCHDFAEDRPENIALLNRMIPDISGRKINEVLYPEFPWYHFIVLNSADYHRILKSGIDARRIHLLQNPVIEPENEYTTVAPERQEHLKRKLRLESSKIICTYPVRVIKRKNIGEFILLGVLFSDMAHFIVTLPPRNPEEIPFYNRWKLFCSTNNINITFEAGEIIDFRELLIISDFCITTSIREGFGMVFLEPWLFGTPVIGRKIPEVIRDLEHSGLEFPRFYDRIAVDAEGTDFKDLDSGQQENLILAVRNDPEKRQKFFNYNPFLISFLETIDNKLINHNREVILKKFSIEQYGKELLGIYREISQ